MDMKIEVGKVYRIWHVRKGVFIAQVRDVLPGDEHDAQFIHVRYDVRPGTAQEAMSTKGDKGNIRESNLRPSLIQRMELLENQSWRLAVEVEPREVEIKEPEKPTIGDRLRSLFRGDEKS